MWAARRSSAATVTVLLDKGALINNVDKVWNSVYTLRVTYNIILIDDMIEQVLEHTYIFGVQSID
jgi:hypothetical protein